MMNSTATLTETLITIYRFMVFCITILTMFCYTYCKERCSSPWRIYKTSDLNIFGSIIAYLFFVFVDPIYAVIYFLDWLIHVGKKKKGE